MGRDNTNKHEKDLHFLHFLLKAFMASVHCCILTQDDAIVSPCVLLFFSFYTVAYQLLVKLRVAPGLPDQGLALHSI